MIRMRMTIRMLVALAEFAACMPGQGEEALLKPGQLPLQQVL